MESGNNGRMHMQSYVSRLMFCCAICVLSLGWHSPKENIPPPNLALCDAEKAASAWLADRIGIKPHTNELFVKMVLYNRPDVVNRLLSVLKYENVATNGTNEAKWYIEFVRSKAQGISYMCSVDTNGCVCLEWSQR